MKKDEKNNFIKLTQKKGVSLIVLIVTIIVVIILAAVVILTISKNNPIESAREARFKEDIRSIQDELSIYLSSEYSQDLGDFDSSSLNLQGDDMVKELPSTEGYKDTIEIFQGKIVYLGNNVKEKKWLESIVGINFPSAWTDTISELTEDGVPIPKGFKYLTGTKETGTVIQDELGNEFVWIPATETSYVKDLTFPGTTPTRDGTLPDGITDEAYDIKKYGGFYIARYEAGIPEGDTTPSNKTGVPVSKQGAIVWTNLSSSNAAVSAKSMISNEYVQTGLLTGTAWDTTCHFIEDVVSLTDSRTYGNYSNSQSPANVTGYGTKQVAGYSDKWSVKNIYDLAGNVLEWTSEFYSSLLLYRGGSYDIGGDRRQVTYRNGGVASGSSDKVGFRVRLYIK